MLDTSQQAYNIMETFDKLHTVLCEKHGEQSEEAMVALQGSCRAFVLYVDLSEAPQHQNED